jgi:PAS domain S-box-containing protein/putative nucleotidyltransferase with HDIG domain
MTQQISIRNPKWSVDMPVKSSRRTQKQLLAENEELQRRLEEAEEILRAIRSGEVDALIVSGVGGEQILTLKQVEEALRLSEVKYRTLVDEVSDGFYVSDEAGVFTFANPALAGIYGVETPQALVGRKFLDFVVPEMLAELGEAHRRLMTAGPSPAVMNSQIVRPDGTRAFIEVKPASIVKGDQIVGSRGVVRDVTERKQTEEKLKSSEKRLKILFDSAPYAYYLSDLKGNFLDGNIAAEKLLGYDKNELIGQNFLKLHLLSLKQIPKAVKLLTKNSFGQDTGPDEFEIRRKDGLIVNVEISTHPVVINDQPVVLGLVIDLTERKRAEEEIHSAKQRIEMLVTSSTVMLYTCQAFDDFDAIYISDNIYAITGYTNEEFLSKGFWANHIHPEDAPKVFEGLVMLFEHNHHKHEYRFMFKDSTYHWMYDELKLNRDSSGNPLEILGTWSDITERKQAEEAIEQAEAKYRNLFENAIEGIFQSTPAGQFITANPALAHMLGYDSPEELITSVNNISTFYVQPGRREDYRQLLESDGEIAGFESEVYHKNGSTLWISENGLTVRDEQGKLIHYEGTLTDITERKRAEEALRESEERYRNILDSIEDGYYEVDTAGNFTFFNPALIRMLGRPAKELTGMNNRLYMTPEAAKAVFQTFNRVFRTAIPEQGFDWEILRPDGTHRSVEASVSPIKAANGSINGFRGTVRDITERKRMVDQLEEERILLRTLIDNLPDRIYVMDVQGRKLISNLADWKASGGKRMEDVIGKTDFDTYPPELAEDYWAADKAVIDTGIAIFNREEPGLDSQGNPIWVLSSKVSLRDGRGKVVGLVGIGHDITERKQAEEKILRQLEHLTALSAIDRVIASVFDLNLSLSEILSHVTKELGIDAADILILNPKRHMLEYGAEHGFRTNAIKKAQLRLGESYAGRTALERQLVHIPNLRDEPDNLLLKTYLKGEDFVCYYGVPLIFKGQVNGVLETFHRTALEPATEWFDFLYTLAGQAAIAIENATLFESLQRSNLELSMAYDATIEGWSHALDLRDKETEGHTQRVTEMTIKLADTFGLGEKELVQVRWGALLHDIGKMGVPDGILLKPGPLTDEEWVAMKKHPTLAYEMLSPIRYLRLAMDIPYCHHEKWDGTGYPRGLKGEQIPLAARIFAVVDVWDALISDRPYRKAWSEEKARLHIQTGAGAHFDPQMVKAFLRMKDTG